MFLRKRYFLSLKKQRNLPDLLAIALQPFFSKLLTIHYGTLSNRVASNLIDLVQGRRLITEPLAYLLQ
ncbi:hypothetical protein KSC_029270 [Ktedonobacter sp. SOSP1-52]|uniref:hypothetical protein n=1 Tax=Ktedonobacter sp. SOSP1-52 TaxID=2778366 RepID=UPI0019168B4C|nr:hypothetical protein [Ktedonobacter sp. SOSP1-52]GHO64035.1 hypothetical protein KSC_029270 [Ktedonobacter sp. SOSP1-52]